MRLVLQEYGLAFIRVHTRLILPAYFFHLHPALAIRAIMKSQTIDVLDPTATGARQLAAPVARLETLRGRVLGIRADRTWVSFQRFADFLEEVVGPHWGVARVVRFDPGVRTGTSEEEQRKVAGFVRDIDAAIVGLGT